MELDGHVLLTKRQEIANGSSRVTEANRGIPNGFAYDSREKTSSKAVPLKSGEGAADALRDTKPRLDVVSVTKRSGGAGA